MRKNH